jgi:hypothetical protein
MKGKALRRALETKDALRVNANVPLIVDTTELITPAIAEEILVRNKSNRPINWKQVEAYAAVMKAGEWRLHAQGIVIGSDGNLLTGQQRLWAVALSGCSVYMRVSRGNPVDAGRFLDRGRPQSARDLASRETEKKHSPTEASIARGVCILTGNRKPSTDQLAEVIAKNSKLVSALLAETAGTKKTKAVVMILAAICEVAKTTEEACGLASRSEKLADRLDLALLPESAAGCWGKGAAFGLAMEQARKCVSEAR